MGQDKGDPEVVPDRCFGVMVVIRRGERRLDVGRSPLLLA